MVEEEDPEDADDMVISPPLTQPGHSDFTVSHHFVYFPLPISLC